MYNFSNEAQIALRLINGSRRKNGREGGGRFFTVDISYRKLISNVSRNVTSVRYFLSAVFYFKWRLVSFYLRGDCPTILENFALSNLPQKCFSLESIVRENNLFLLSK